MAIKAFFKTFPQFSKHSAYIMGESYGGIYVPMLAVKVIRGMEEFPINFKVYLFFSFEMNFFFLLKQ